MNENPFATLESILEIILTAVVIIVLLSTLA